MKTTLILIGKTTDKHITALIDEYKQRLSHYLNFEIVIIPELKNTKNLSFEQQKNAEGELILKQLTQADTIVLLDEHGKEQSSVRFSKWVEKKLGSTPRRLVFIIGGPYGFSNSVREKASELISLSQMTFSHQMVRLIFIEQLYRAMTIINNEPYHHE